VANTICGKQNIRLLCIHKLGILLSLAKHSVLFKHSPLSVHNLAHFVVTLNAESGRVLLLPSKTQATVLITHETAASLLERIGFSDPVPKVAFLLTSWEGELVLWLATEWAAGRHWFDSKSRLPASSFAYLAKWTAYRISSIIVVFVVLVCKSYSQKPQEAQNLLVTEALLSTLLHAIVYVSRQFPECTCVDCK
jgi:hypothetical protein